MPVHDTIRPIRWVDDHLELLDQRLLPEQERRIHCADYVAVTDAIRNMVVRGAPAIGIAAAYGVVLAARALAIDDRQALECALEPALQRLAESRPTAVNLVWALDRMRRCLAAAGADPVSALLGEANAIASEDLAANRRMGELGAGIFQERCAAVLTHCNTGSLATAGFGTALGVIRQGFADGTISRVYAGETRPWLQGARLTAWELARDGIPVTVLADSAAALLMRQGGVRWVIVGADRVTANGDVVNKIGTYGLALAARAHGVGFMVVAPSSTVDMQLADGDRVTIEYRDDAEVLSVRGQRIAADGASGWNPVFDVTPAALVSVLVTERGVIEKPDRDGMARLFADAGEPVRNVR
ncbi:MAG: S-methyl-5-thioribose-1-phosphate isomerase [Aquisalimonadaceae bacterium]